MRRTWTAAAALMIFPVGAASADSERSKEKAALIDLATGEEADEGKGKLKRNDEDFIYVAKFPAVVGDVYSVGVCGFNDPDSCEETAGFNEDSLCGWSDVLNNNGEPFCFYGGAELIEEDEDSDDDSSDDDDACDEEDDGTTLFKIRGKWNGDEPVLLGDGLTNLAGSEVILYVRSHGPALTGDDLEAQLADPSGGCDINECAEAYNAIFPAP